MKNLKVLLKDMPNKTNLRLFFNERLLNRGKLVRFSAYNSQGIIYEVKLSEGHDILFNQSYGYIQSVNFKKNTVIFAIHAKEFSHIMNEINFFRKFPKDAEKLGYTVI